MPARVLNRLSVTRIAALMGILGGLIVIGVSAAIGYAEWQRLVAEATQEAATDAYFLADHANRLIEVADIAMTSTDHAIAGRGWDDIETDAALYGRLKGLATGLPYISDVWLNDDAGRLRATSFAFPTPYSSAVDRENFIAARGPGGGVFVGPRIVAKLNNTQTFLLSRRLENPDGAFRGMVSATADLAYFSDYWSRLRLPPGGRVLLIRASGAGVLASYPTSPSGAASDAAPEFMTAIAGAPDEGVGRVTLAGGDQRVFAHRRVANLPLYIGVSMAQAGLVKAWFDWFRLVAPLVALALLGLFALTALALRQGRRERAAALQIARARQALEEANDELDFKVQARTAALTETNEEIQRFAYIVSHDLRAPLLNITGFASELETIRDDLFTPNPTTERDEMKRDFDEALGFIKAAIRKMDGLIIAILKLSREGRRVFRPEPLDMSELMRDVSDALRHQADAAGARVEIDALPPITADRVAVGQVFANLLDNAIKYLDPARPGVIRVEGRQADGEVVYSVADNGRGIAEADLERVFELFRRAGPQDRPGDGIGLAHVRTLTRSLGGRIDLSSTFGKGTVFNVHLPKTMVRTL